MEAINPLMIVEVMRGTLTTFLVITIVVCVIVFVVMKHKNIKDKEIETYVESPNTVSSSSSTYIPEHCDILEGDITQLGSRAHIAKDALLTNNRILKWKPDKTATSNNTLCYLFNDPSNLANDYILENTVCDKTNPLFKDNPMITRVFTDTTLEATYTRPIQKCVFEIDSNQVNGENLRKFYGTADSLDCDQKMQSMNISLLQAQKEQLTAANAMAKYAEYYGTMSNLYTKNVKDLNDCIINKVNYQTQYDILYNSNLEFKRINSFLSNEYARCQDASDNLVNTKRKVISDLENDITKQEKHYNTAYDLSKNCQKYLSSSTKVQQVSDYNTASSIESLAYCTSNNLSLQDGIESCSTRLTQTTSLGNTFEMDWNGCVPQKAAYIACKPEVARCRPMLATCDTDTVTTQTKYNSEVDMYTVCSVKEDAINNQYQLCNGSNVTLTNIKNQLDSTLNAQRQKITDLNSSYKTCSDELATSMTKHDELKRRNTSLYDELAKLKERCSRIEETGNANALEIMQSAMVTEAKAIAETITNSCSTRAAPKPPNKMLDTTKGPICANINGRYNTYLGANPKQIYKSVIMKMVPPTYTTGTFVFNGEYTFNITCGKGGDTSEYRFSDTKGLERVGTLDSNMQITWERNDRWSDYIASDDPRFGAGTAKTA